VDFELRVQVSIKALVNAFMICLLSMSQTTRGWLFFLDIAKIEKKDLFYSNFYEKTFDFL